jgi:hypothetical protein
LNKPSCKQTNNKQQTTNNKQQTTNNKQQTTNNKQQTTNNKQTMMTYADVCHKNIAKETFHRVIHQMKGHFVTKTYHYSHDFLQKVINILGKRISLETVSLVNAPQFTPTGQNILTRLHTVREMWETILVSQGFVAAFRNTRTVGIGRRQLEQDSVAVIQQQWRNAICDPKRMICRTRLVKEFNQLNQY